MKWPVLIINILSFMKCSQIEAFTEIKLAYRADLALSVYF